MSHYRVSVSMNFDDDVIDENDAVKRMVEWLSANADIAGYRVELFEQYGDLMPLADWFIDAEEVT